MKGIPQEKWYFKNSVFIIALLLFGPFALALLWLNPYFSRNTKVILTIIVLGLSYALGAILIKSSENLKLLLRGF